MKILNKIKKQIRQKYFLNSIKCIVWDYDGTLYKSDEIGDELKNVFFMISKKNEKNLSEFEFDKKSQLLGSWSAAASFFTSIPERKILDLSEKKIDKLKFVKKNLKLVNFIESTKDKYIHLILTNSTKKEVILGLKKIGFKTNIFKEILARDSSEYLKPNFVLFKKIEGYTGLKKNKHLCVGDSFFCDIKPAKEYGFKSLFIWEMMDLI